MNKVAHLNLKALSIKDRPREKLELGGPKSLSDSELLAILLASGNKEETAIQLAQRILNTYQNSVNQLFNLSITDFTKFKGVGKVKAITIIAALELAKRRKIAMVDETKITSSQQAYQIFYPMLSDLNYEAFCVVYLKHNKTIIHQELISKGGINTVTVDIKLILNHALTHLASNIIIAHNHPTGKLEPSKQDIELTTKIKQAAALVDITLLDHIVLGAQEYFSFADYNLI